MKQSCPLGYTLADLEIIFPDEDERKKFGKWMHGQTGAICEAHGMIVYAWDVNRYIERKPVID